MKYVPGQITTAQLPQQSLVPSYDLALTLLR
jgi:hypothetical protein